MLLVLLIANGNDIGREIRPTQTLICCPRKQGNRLCRRSHSTTDVLHPFNGSQLRVPEEFKS